MAATNPYALKPLYFALVSPATGKYVRAFFFLGNVPKAVLEAARRGRGTGKDPRAADWAAKDAAILRRYYGSHWRELLTADDPPRPDPLATLGAIARAAPVVKFGGGGNVDLDFGDLGSLDDLGSNDSDAVDATPAAFRGAAASLAARPPVYTDIAVYPEDTIYDLRLKMQLASGISLYRAHVFYYVNDDGPYVPYRVTVDGAPVVSDWLSLGEHAVSSKDDVSRVAGISVDTRQAERRDGIAVAALDTFTPLCPTESLRTNRVYFVDLHSVIPPLGAPERPNDNLSGALRDRLQFDLLWWGALINFWPWLGPNACRLALADPGRIAEEFPLLDPDSTSLAVRIRAERNISDAALRWRESATRGGRASTAVTSATVAVVPTSARMVVGVRNVFDWVATDATVSAAMARYEDVAPGGGSVPVLARKRSLLSYGPRSARAVDWFLSRTARPDTVSFALVRGAPDDELLSRAAPYAFVTVGSGGRYEVTADWREDDRIGFDAVAREIGALVAPLVERINSMGGAAFPVGGSLGLPGGGNRSGSGSVAPQLGAITVSTFWPRAVSVAAFRDLKERFRAYERAGVVGIRGLQQAGTYAFAFRRGVTAYDPRLGARLEDVNQYAWLTDPAAAARWTSTFAGRSVRIHHRATDLRIEIVDADSLAEFQLICRYLFAFLDGLLVGSNKLRLEAVDAPSNAPPSLAASRRLRRLQERDPNLFDLKKFDPGATVYSVLCQSGRQPHVYNDDEARGLSNRKRDALVRYWNFTDDEPAFYECPDPAYPHLSFRSGSHPLGYCLPCCKKTRPAAGSRAALTNSECVSASCADTTQDDSTFSRHILAYGKYVPLGRVAELPRELREGLFLDAMPPPYGVYQIGVEQSAPAVPDSGFVYSIAYVLGLGDTTADTVLEELAAAAASMPDTFYCLGDGAGALFTSAAELADAIRSAFIRRDTLLSPFGPGGAAADAVRPIFADLTRLVFGVEVVEFVEEGGAVEAWAPAGTMASLGATHGTVALLMRCESGTNPLAGLNPKLFVRVPLEDRWMAARRTFDLEGTVAAGQNDEFVVDTVAATVRDLLLLGGGSSGSDSRQADSRQADYALITRWLDAASMPPMVSRLINLHGLCYGVMVGEPAVYLPIRASAFPNDGIDTVFGARPDAGAASDVKRMIVSLNKHIAAAESDKFSPIESANEIQDASGQTIGFISTQGLYYFHAPALETSTTSAIKFPYDSRNVDGAILAKVTGRAVEAAAETKPRLELATAARYRNELYRLWRAEFANVISGDRNSKLRKKIEAVILDTRFDSTTSVAALRRKLFELLKDTPRDLAVIRSIVQDAYANSPRNPARTALSLLEATAFEFDRSTLIRLRSLSTADEVAHAVREIMAGHIDVRPAGTYVEVRNIYSACGAESGAPTQCAGRRLIVPEDRVDDLYSILAADIRSDSPFESSLLSAAGTGIIDSFEFIRRPGEHLSIQVDGAT